VIAVQDDRHLALVLRHFPIRPQQPIFVSLWNELEPVALVKPDRPLRVGPRSHEHMTHCLAPQFLEEQRTEAAATLAQDDVSGAVARKRCRAHSVLVALALPTVPSTTSHRGELTPKSRVESA
jgi:hypothetical protein